MRTLGGYPAFSIPLGYYLAFEEKFKDEAEVKNIESISEQKNFKDEALEV